jgi:hypothetical protein
MSLDIEAQLRFRFALRNFLYYMFTIQDSFINSAGRGIFPPYPFPTLGGGIQQEKENIYMGILGESSWSL